MATTNANAEGRGKALFAQVRFYVQCDQALTVNEAETVSQADLYVEQF